MTWRSNRTRASTGPRWGRRASGAAQKLMIWCLSGTLAKSVRRVKSYVAVTSLFCSVGLQANTVDSSTCPPEGGRYIDQNQVLTQTLKPHPAKLAVPNRF